MSDTDCDNNPFRQLDKHIFPDTRNPGKKSAPGKRKQPEIAPVETDDALFLQSMQAIHPAGAASVHTPAEAELSEFEAAMRGVHPLAGKGREIPPEPVCKTAPPTVNDPLRDFLDGKFAFALQHTNEYAEGHVLGLDPITIRKLQAGQFSPEGSLDLHGLNTLQAYQHLIGFMRNAYLRSWRTVLIVSGRGLNSPHGLPVLREKVQIWLTQEPLRRVVLAFCTAQQTNGGAGALYVLLRKMRKGQGKVQWDRTPVDPDLLL